MYISQRMMLAALLTLGLHGILLSRQIQQQPQNLQPKSLPRKITVSLKRLPPPLPPIKKIIQKAQDLPELSITERQPVRPVPPMPKKIVQKVPTLPKIAQIQRQPVRPIPPKPEKKISTAHQALPKLSRVARKTLRPVDLKTVKKPKPVSPSVHSRSVVRNAQPVVSKPVRQKKQAVSRTLSTRRAVSSTVRTAARTRPPVSTAVTREAAPLYKTNPPPKYPRMARRRGLEGLVTIEAKIDINGKVTELRLFAGSGHKLLDKAALKAVRGWKFSPGTVGGRARSMWVKVPVRFELH